MKKTRQVSMTIREEQHRRLAEVARRQERSVSGLVRKIIEDFLKGIQEKAADER